MWPFTKKKELTKGNLVKAERSARMQRISTSLNQAAQIRSGVSDRLGAIFSEINKVKQEIKRVRKELDPVARRKIPLSCVYHLNRAKYHVSRIIGKLR